MPSSSPAGGALALPLPSSVAEGALGLGRERGGGGSSCFVRETRFVVPTAVVDEASMEPFVCSGDAHMVLPAPVVELTKYSQPNLIMNPRSSEPEASNKETTTIHKVCCRSPPPFILSPTPMPLPPAIPSSPSLPAATMFQNKELTPTQLRRRHLIPPASDTVASHRSSDRRSGGRLAGEEAAWGGRRRRGGGGGAMETEVFPVVDLRVLSQSDLDALAAASAHAVAPGGSCPDADQLPPLKIDRAVFNESAGSRKQTFSRVRFGAAAAVAASPSSPSPSAAAKLPRGNDKEDSFIAYHLRRLFAPDDPSSPQTQTLALPAPPSPDPDQLTTNSKGVSVDLVSLSRLADPYDAELGKRTAGMTTEEELMGFISSLAGQWVSQRMRRKLVDASFFGDHLPSGWRLQLGIKRKDRKAWVNCFSYVSPKGQSFATCQEVSAYLMSLLGYPEFKTDNIEYGSTQQHGLCADDGVNVLGVQHQIGTGMDSQSILPVASITFSSHSRDQDETDADDINSYECQQCNLTFHGQSAYAHHLITFHKMGSKRRKINKVGKFGEPVIGKDGKFECPVCNKTFEEQSRYFGHVGSHAKYHGLTPEAFLQTLSGKVGLSCSLQDLVGSPQLNEKTTASEARSQHHNCSTKHGGNSTRDAPSTWTYRNNVTNCADRTVPRTAPQPNDHMDCRVSGFAEATNFNDQAGRHQGFRPSSFGTTNHCQGQIIDHAVAASKHAEVNNSMKSRDVNLNSRLNTISFPIATANNETSTALNDVNRSCITGKGFSGSFSNNDGAASIVLPSSGLNNKIPSSLGVADRSSIAARSFNAGYVNENGASEANNIGNKNNTMVYQTSLAMRPVSPCDLQLGFSGQKQQILPGYGELRPAASGSPQLGGMAANSSIPTRPSQPQFGSMARTDALPTGPSQPGSLARPNFVPTGFSQFASRPPTSVPPADSSQFAGGMARQNIPTTSEPTLVLGYTPQMVNGPPAQLGWDLSLSRMVSEGMLPVLCIWCNSQFHHFGPIDAQQSGSFGFICPACKEKMSGNPNAPNNAVRVY
uniref:C2H2-type domain-containing protein n=1 Tax=Oryza nivara TaxID=4536 RepID=A0A0E0IDI9_ORYNI